MNEVATLWRCQLCGSCFLFVTNVNVPKFPNIEVIPNDNNPDMIRLLDCPTCSKFCGNDEQGNKLLMPSKRVNFGSEFAWYTGTLSSPLALNEEQKVWKKCQGDGPAEVTLHDGFLVDMDPIRDYLDDLGFVESRFLGEAMVPTIRADVENFIKLLNLKCVGVSFDIELFESNKCVFGDLFSNDEEVSNSIQLWKRLLNLDS